MYGDRPHVMKIESDVSRDGTTLNALGLECGVECAESETRDTVWAGRASRARGVRPARARRGPAARPAAAPRVRERRTVNGN